MTKLRVTEGRLLKLLEDAYNWGGTTEDFIGFHNWVEKTLKEIRQENKSEDAENIIHERSYVRERR